MSNHKQVKKLISCIFENQDILNAKNKFTNSKRFCDLKIFNKLMQDKLSVLQSELNTNIHEIIEINVFDLDGNIFFTYVLNTKEKIYKNISPKNMIERLKSGNKFTQKYKLDIVNKVLSDKLPGYWINNTDKNDNYFSAMYTPDGTSVSTTPVPTLTSITDLDGNIITSIYPGQIFIVNGTGFVENSLIIFNSSGFQYSRFAFCVSSNIVKTDISADTVNIIGNTIKLSYSYDVTGNGDFVYSSNSLTFIVEALQSAEIPVITGIDVLWGHNYTITKTNNNSYTIAINSNPNAYITIPIQLIGTGLSTTGVVYFKAQSIEEPEYITPVTNNELPIFIKNETNAIGYIYNISSKLLFYNNVFNVSCMSGGKMSNTFPISITFTEMST